ncbi:MAG: response regulator transcription factor [Burkholderiales bacterium]
MSTRVLIVEDNPVARSFLVRVVRESFSDDIEFTEASDLASARRAFAPLAEAATPTEPFRLILCDLEADDGRGLELLSELSRHPATKIATTLHSDDEHLFPALQCGADGYLLKEDRFEVLVEELQKIVRGQPPLSPAIARRLLNFFRSGESAAPANGTALTPRENDVLLHLSKGFTLKEVARVLGIQWFAVNDHIRAVYHKLADASSHARRVPTPADRAN